MKRWPLIIAAITLLLQTPSAAAAEPSSTFTVGTIVSRTSDEDGIETRIRITRGADAGMEFSVQEQTLDLYEERQFGIGDSVVVETIVRTDGSREFIMRESYRLPALIWLFVLFLGLAFILGGKTSVMSVLGLLVSIGILVWMVIPHILNGGNPMIASLLGCILIACISLYVAHGFSRRTSIALLSTLITLGCSALLATFFVHAAKLFGMGSEEAFYLQSGQLADIDLRGLLLGGILIGCLGVLDDITTAQTAAVDEIRKANPSLSGVQLRKAGFSVGKEHIASLINTLALAYAGTSLPLLLLFQTQADFPLWVTLNGEFIAEEIVRTLVGSATLLMAVPISTWLASVLLKHSRNTRSHSHHHHA